MSLYWKWYKWRACVGTSRDVGIAIGSGTVIEVESADIVLVRNDPRDVVIISFAKKTYKKMLENLFWATGYNTFAISLVAEFFLV